MDKDFEGVEHNPSLNPRGFLGPTPEESYRAGAAMRTKLDQAIREICREEISQHLEMAKQMAAFAGQLTPPKPCEECAKHKENSVRFQHCLGLAKIALRKIAQLDPVAAAQRAQASMPAEHDIAKLTLREIERQEAEEDG